MSTESLLTEIRDLLRHLVAAVAAKTIAHDKDLDSKFGNPVIKAKDPRDWTGPTMIGRTFSQCPAEYLDLVASRLDYFADNSKAENKLTSAGKPVERYNRADAARARGWAARVRAGYVPPADDDDDTQF